MWRSKRATRQTQATLDERAAHSGSILLGHTLYLDDEGACGPFILEELTWKGCKHALDDAYIFGPNFVAWLTESILPKPELGFHFTLSP